jgi:ferrous iron transport protein A
MVLSDLRPGEKGMVLGVETIESLVVDSDISYRMKELGFIPGTEVTILHRAPFGGDPLVVRVRGSSFGLRKCEARLVNIEKK